MRKKNKTMRAAGALFLATMLTTSMTAGTFAKYTTGDSASDSARVAKFGVVAAVDGTLFGDAYSAAAGNSIQAYSSSGSTVKSVAQNDMVVAPGTKNDTGLTLEVTGKPEVSTTVILNSAVDNSGKAYADSDIVLQAGTYGVMKAYTGTVTADNVASFYKYDGAKYVVASAADLTGGVILYKLYDSTGAVTQYYPITWKVDDVLVANQEAVKTQLLAALAVSKTPNEAYTLSKKVTWEWDFDDNGAGTNDKKDTILGDMIADCKDSLNYTVVKLNLDGSAYEPVSYTTVRAATDSANEVVVAYVGSTVPTSISDTSICACLTVSFSARLTVNQVD